jgi:beta-lactamase regulating signal transducer with metallopeptidase domain
MNSHEAISLAIVSIKAFTVVTLIVFAVRPAFRQAFGAACAWHLWTLLPLVLLVTLASAMGFQVPAVHAPWFVALSAVAQTPAVSKRVAPGFDEADLLVLVWLIGAGATGVTITWAQWRYRRALEDAQHLFSLNSTLVLRATRSDIGPATVGAWRPSIVVPVDFDSRYSAAERELILAHEAMHVRRHDGVWLLAAHVTVMVLWFHPLAWWALRAFRHDQELACDADVTALPSTDRLAYAQAIMNVHDRRAPMLPVGNTWGYQHPLTERIAMLKRSRNGLFGQLAGYASLVIFGCGLVATANAFVGPSGAEPAKISADYQLSLVVKLREKVVATPTICLRGSTPGGISGGDLDKEGRPEWSMDFTATPASPSSATIQMHGSVRQANDKYSSLFPTVTTKLGEASSIDFFQLDGKPNVTITTVAGCPAAAKSA